MGHSKKILHAVATNVISDFFDKLFFVEFLGAVGIRKINATGESDSGWILTSLTESFFESETTFVSANLTSRRGNKAPWKGHKRVIGIQRSTP